MRLWKILGALVLVAALSSAAFASAAKLNLNSQGVQAGSAIVHGCQGDAALGVSYGTHYDNSISAFLVDTVTVSGIADACLSIPGAPRATEVVLTFGPPAFGSQNIGLKTILGPSVVYILPAGSQPSVADLTDVHVLIK